MRHHPEMTKFVARPVHLATLFLFFIGFAPAHSRAQDTASNVARVSFVQGSVQLLAGQGSDFQQAVMNMPVVEGAQLQTGGDGQAEVEFGDGSVARLTPNSSLQFGHLGLDQVQLQQAAGLAYYEFNVGDGHPPFTVQFSNATVQATANTIMRIGLDAGWDVAVISGAVNLEGQGSAVPVGENQSARSGSDPNGAPYTVAQGINGDSWDNWNQDRDQAIAQEASAQTPVRDESANPDNEAWNDLDADGNWYPVEGEGNVWVPAGVGAGWDPYGSGYWGYYPTLGYTWISGYPWGWLPYHCGAWNYYSFGWGWAPGGGCGRVWSPVVIVRHHPPGWNMPLHPPSGIRPQPGRLVVVDRGPEAKGPWGLRGGPAPRPDHQMALNFKGNAVAPIGRVDVRPQAFAAARGTAPGSRAVLGGTVPGVGPRPSANSTYLGGNYQRPAQSGAVSPQMQRPVQPAPSYGQRPQGYSPPVGAAQPNMQRQQTTNMQRQQTNSPPVGAAQSNMQRPQAYSPPPAQSYNQQRNTYVAQPPPTPHYSSPPPQQHYSAPPARSAPAGNHR
jgi:FecR protein